MVKCITHVKRLFNKMKSRVKKAFDTKTLFKVLIKMLEYLSLILKVIEQMNNLFK